MDTSKEITLKFYLEAVKKISALSNNLQNHKRRLSEAVQRIQDYIQCFKIVDLDKKGVIYPKVMQNFLIKHKYYLDPRQISRFYAKYSHEKKYLAYEDLLEALLPHQDYILVAHTLSNISQTSNVPSKFSYSCNQDRVKTIQYFTAFILKLQISYLSQDYRLMKDVTKNSQRIGALLWRLLDHNHVNQVGYQNIAHIASQFGIKMMQAQWMSYLYWNFHSYKRSINRSDFMRLLDIQNQRKRATSACQIDQFKLEQQIYKRAEQDRLRTIRIEEAVKQKLKMVPNLTSYEYRQIVKEEHFPFEYLNVKKELRGKAGYSKPKNMIKYVVQRSE